MGSPAVARAASGPHNWQELRKRNHQLHQGATSARVPEYRRDSAMVRNVQAAPKWPAFTRQKEEAGAVVDRGKVSSSAPRARRAVSLALKQEGRTSDRRRRDCQKKKKKNQERKNMTEESPPVSCVCFLGCSSRTGGDPGGRSQAVGSGKRHKTCSTGWLATAATLSMMCALALHCLHRQSNQLSL